MEFTTAAFRVGHSQISGQQQGIDNNGNVVFQEWLAQAFGNTPVQDKANGIDALIRNLSNDFSQQTDVYAVPELRNLARGPAGFHRPDRDRRRTRARRWPWHPEPDPGGAWPRALYLVLADHFGPDRASQSAAGLRHG